MFPVVGGEHVIGRLHDARVPGSGRRRLREHERRGVLEQLLLHEVRGRRLQVLLGAELTFNITVQVGPRQGQSYQH